MKNDNLFNSKNSDLLEEEINIRPFFKTILRGKKFIFIATFLTIILNIFYANSLKPIYRGGFEILISKASPDDSNNKRLTLEGVLNMAGNGGKTQELILKSPSVLKPVYNFLLKEYEKQGKSTTNMTYESWFKNELEIKFKEGSKILSVTVVNSDKELIRSTLNKISERYQDFSKSDTEKSFKKTIKFLESQQTIYREKGLKAHKKLNQFSIDNGLGNKEGFIIQSKNTSPFDDKQSDILSPGKRFQSQFSLLETYETQYTNYSKFLKSNSETLEKLRSKIENLRSALKRPNQILLTFEELKQNAKYHDDINNTINKELLQLKFAQAKQLEPWQLISDPTIEKRKIAPHKAKIVATGFLFSLLISILIVILYEKLKGTLYEKNSIKKILSCKYLDTLYQNNLNLNSLIIENGIKNNLTKNNSRIGLITINDSGMDFLNNLITEINYDVLKEFDFFDREALKNFDNLFLLIESGKTNLKLINKISKCISYSEEKFNGWFFVEENT